MAEQQNQATLPNTTNQDLNPKSSIHKPFSPLSAFLKKNPKEFVSLFSLAELCLLDQDEMNLYHATLKVLRDNYSHDETVRIEARRNVELQQCKEMAMKMLMNDEPIEKIAKYTRLSIEEIKAINIIS